MKILLRASCAAVLTATALAQPKPPSLSQAISSRLTAAKLNADVSFLASDELQGRGTPSPGLDKAAEFIAAHFKQAGLEPAGDDGYYQTAPFANITPNLDGLTFALEDGGQTIQAKKSDMGVQDPAAVNLEHAAAVKAMGDDLAALDALTPEQVRGKVLVIEIPEATGGGGQRGGRGGTFALTQRIPALAAKLQPALVVMVRSNGQGIGTATRLREVLPGTTVPVLAVWDEAVRTALSAAKPGPLDVKFSAHIAAPTVAPVKLRNVIGVLRGSDPVLKDTYVLITAHYDHLGVRGTGEGDHIYNGANDDASGTASVMEIASTLASLPNRPKRSMVFIALFGEELGLVGSRYYGRHPIFPFAKTVGDLNLEQLGRTDVDDGVRKGLVNITGYDFSSLTDDLKKAGQENDIEVVKDEKNSDSFFARSDNQAFADAGVPAHTLSVGYVFPDYHKPGDEASKIDYENMAKVDRTVALAIFRVADSTVPPHWNSENQKTERYVKAYEALHQSGGSK